jgi:hypothetical protein
LSQEGQIKEGIAQSKTPQPKIGSHGHKRQKTARQSPQIFLQSVQDFSSGKLNRFLSKSFIQEVSFRGKENFIDIMEKGTFYSID